MGTAGPCLADIALAVAGMLVPLRVTHSESVSSKILLHFHNIHNVNQSFAILHYISNESENEVYEVSDQLRKCNVQSWQLG